MKKALIGLGLGALLLACPVSAAELAVITADIDGSGTQETVTLTGDKLTNGSTYYENLLLTVHGPQGNILTAYKPDVKGGYNCLLEKVPVAGGKDQILLLAGQGGRGAAVNARIFDFGKRHQVKEAFGAVEDMGIGAVASYAPDKTYVVSYDLNGQRETVRYKAEGRDNLKVFAQDGSVAKTYLRPKVTSLTSLSYVQGKLYTTQNIMSADLKTTLGQVVGIWENLKGSWQPQHVGIRNLDVTAEKDAWEMGVNAGANAGNWRLYPRDRWEKDVESCYPLIGVAEAPQVQNKLNETLYQIVTQGHLEDERAYRIQFAGPNLLSVVLYRQPKNGEPIEKILNFDMRSGALITTEQMFNTDNSDFLKVLRLTGKPQGIRLSKVPEDWFYNGHDFVFKAEESPSKKEAKKTKLEISIPGTDLYEFVKDKDLPKSK